ncbi:unnamed protein product [Ceratitis capitata]|uniref:(Mediterranean fruit fly) hypothetical protein n=1 Tax=Ceratitis capitata TaxID=7213 RepID=A0A811VG35_CERCA|nr:unnamed protein product [Ceratitis capitata]
MLEIRIHSLQRLAAYTLVVTIIIYPTISLADDQIAIEMRHPDSSEIFLENGVVIPKTNFSGVAINPSPTLQKQKELSRARRSKAEPKDIKKNGRTLRKANTERKRKKLFVPVICG